MGKRKPTDKAARFMAANDSYPVVEAAVIGNGGRGGLYWLTNKDQWTLTKQDLESMPSGYPKWLGL